MLYFLVSVLNIHLTDVFYDCFGEGASGYSEGLFFYLGKALILADMFNGLYRRKDMLRQLLYFFESGNI